ncbi:diguanylate cyclase (GGDEF)-like protein [Sphingomonas sp. BE138]|uniref:diguanylate cyclase domain-containing protein n=1 Tax=Sphingomonas sp. BE138 TaxID=2817845 RepID=UPI0028634B07|nr:diguanylate cyclase [Sphingomonas sp. BE138]MDR6788362.1 diguanylate cyclase (GGDEF)-like protein [Sphingomonas sp. BE138]
MTNDLSASRRYDEEARAAALQALALLDTAPEQEFDALVALAAELLGCPTALLNLVDHDRLFVKARSTPGAMSFDRDSAFCDRTVVEDRLVVIDDTLADERFCKSRLVTDAGVRFYAGAPLHVPDPEGVRRAVGTLCVVDHRPRHADPRELAALAHLATLAEALLEARRTALKAIHIATTGEELVTRLGRQDQIFRQAEQIAAIGSWRLSLGDGLLDWSDNVYRIHGLPVGSHKPPLDDALSFYPEHSRALVQSALDDAVSQGKPLSIETDFLTADGRLRRVRAMADPEIVDGRVVALVGVFQDVTERHALEQQLRRSADTDALTGIANRAAFDRELQEAMDRARACRTPLHLALIDLDGFKAINDTLGHGAGDDVLRLTGQALREPWLMNSMVARIGGDEFAVIVEHPALAADIDALRERLEAALRVSVEADGVRMSSAGSVGIAAIDDQCHSLRDFARRADAILYAAKRARVGLRSMPRAA